MWGFLPGLGLAMSLITPLGILLGLYFLARIVSALERIAAHYDRDLR